MNIDELITDTIELMQEMRSRAEKAERERDEAIKALSEQAQLRGQAEGCLAASEMAGVVDGWKTRADNLQKRLSVLESAAAKAVQHRSEYQRSLPVRLEQLANGYDATKARAEAAEAKVVRLREALEPFALIAEWDIGDDERDGDQFHQVAPRHAVAGVLAVGHFRAALAAMEATDE